MGLADWDWWQHNHSLDPEDKVEGTSSLKIVHEDACLCCMAGTLNVPNGAVETYYKYSAPNISFWFIFRCGVDVGTYALQDCYVLDADFSHDLMVVLNKFIGTTGTTISLGGAKTLPIGEWLRLRAVGYEKAGKLYAYVERFTTVWEKVTDVVFDEEPEWAGRALNRMGIGHTGGGASKWDSTSLYSITP